MLMQQAIVVNQEVEMTNVLMELTKETVFASCSEWTKNGSIRRSIWWFWRLYFPTIIQQHAFGKCQIFANDGTELAEARKPFKFIFQKYRRSWAVKK